MARRRSLWPSFAKWVLIPLAIWAIGYFAIGPMVGGRLDEPATRVLGGDEPAFAPEPAKAESAKPTKAAKTRKSRKSKGPEVDVVAKREPAAEPPPMDADPVIVPALPDEGSGGGTGN
ncbi:MAG: hypothetical protein HYR64_03165 [Fimbriimonas ginsengisoli]|uniref:Uncharacterized protein n=1 Tax=Fimbriimonas ginsengisoli TaxID=1005039 RepID=A0A931PT44_FIMGI|nr:hypothetical protein [Fimbriimonas ginsengisoli]